MTRLLLVILTALAAAAGPALAQGKLPAKGSEFFRFFLHRHDLTPLTNEQDAFNNPGDTIIIAVGDVDWLSEGNTAARLEQFLLAGGSALITTDRQYDNKQPDTWEGRFGFELTGHHLTADAADLHDGVAGRPFVRPAQRLPFPNPNSPFVMLEGITGDGPTAVTTDRPTEMALTPNFLRPGWAVTRLARYPASTKRLAGGKSPDHYDNFAVAMRAANDVGRLLVVADHSVFLNGQMKFTVDEETGNVSFPTANIRFTEQMTDWLRGPGKRRTKCLFVQDGEVIPVFATKGQLPPDMMPPIPPIAPDVLINLLLRAANPMIGELQNRARPNNALSRWPGPAAIRRAFLVFLSLVLLWLIWSRVGKATRGDDRSRWTSLAMLGGLLPKGSANKRKRADLIETGNVYEAARWRVRDRFDRLGGQPTASGDMPPFLMADSSRQAVGLEQQVRRLWQIGYGSRPVPVPIHLWDELNVNLERAVRLAAKGVWCFAAGAGETKGS